MDRDLLLGVVAVQLALATPQQVMAAASAYVADRSKSIAERLRADGVLDDQRLSMLEAMVDDAVKAHGGDVHQTMQSLGGDQVLFRSFGGSLVRDEGGEVSVRPADEIHQDSGEDTAAVTAESAGRYRSEGQEVGRGGIGRVLIAFDQHLGREVAVKELLADTTGSPPPSRRSDGTSKTGALVARFLREARLTGQLEHPNIVPVYELGQRENGEFYYTMKLVRGRTLARALADCETIGDRLKLLHHYVSLCHAIAYAHSRGIIHRDIKTENVMVGEFGETVVLDWGLAKVEGKKDIRGNELARDLQLLHDEGAGQTVDGSAIGTPAYMSPEQADGAIDDIDERSDVWSLGAVLYELLTGRPPFEGVTPFEVIGKVMKDEVVPAVQRSDAVPVELSAVADKALCRAKPGRYRSAGDIAAEIEAYMAGGRIAAYEYSSWELLRGFVAKNKVAVVSGVAIVLLIAVSAVGLLRAYREADEARQHADVLRQQAEQSELAAHLILANAYREKADRLFRESFHLEARIYAAASLLHNPASPQGPFVDADFARQHPKSRQLRVEAYSIFYQASLEPSLWPERVIQHDVRDLAAVAASPDGKRLVIGGKDPDARVWDLDGGRRLGRLPGHTGDVSAVAWSPDGKTIATGDRSGAVRLWTSADLRLLETHQWHDRAVQQLRFSPDGRLLGASSPRGIVVWDQEQRKAKHDEGLCEEVFYAPFDFAPDGRRLVCTIRAGLALVDVESWTTTAEIPHDGARGGRALAFSPDGQIVVKAEHTNVAKVFSLDQGKIVATLRGHSESVTHLAFAPRGEVLVTAGNDGTVRLWDTASWTLQQGIASRGAPITDIEFLADGLRLAVASRDGTTRIYRVASSEALGVLQARGGSRSRLDFAPDGRMLAAAGRTATVIWEVPNGRVVQELPHDLTSWDVGFSPDGGTLAVGYAGATDGEDEQVRLFDVATGRQLVALPGLVSVVHHVDYSPDGRFLVAGDRRTRQARVMVWDAKSYELRRELDGANAGSVSPDGTRIATASLDRTVKLWDAETGRLVHTLQGHTARVDDVQFSHDGKLLASSDYQGSVRLWDLEQPGSSTELEGHRRWVNEVRFSPDDRWLATASDDGSARVWSLDSREAVLIVQTSEECCAAAFSPDGKTLAVEDGATVKLFPLDLSVREAEPRDLLEQAQNEAGLKLDGFELVSLR